MINVDSFKFEYWIFIFESYNIVIAKHKTLQTIFCCSSLDILKGKSSGKRSLSLFRGLQSWSNEKKVTIVSTDSQTQSKHFPSSLLRFSYLLVMKIEYDWINLVNLTALIGYWKVIKSKI